MKRVIILLTVLLLTTAAFSQEFNPGAINYLQRQFINEEGPVNEWHLAFRCAPVVAGWAISVPLNSLAVGCYMNATTWDFYRPIFVWRVNDEVFVSYYIKGTDYLSFLTLTR